MKQVQKYILGLLPFCLVGLLVFSTSCAKEHFVDASQITILNYDSIPLTIYVNGEEATSFESFWGEVHLNSGSYEIVAKSEGIEVDKINVKLPAYTPENKFDKHIFNVSGDVSYALCDMRYQYFNGHDMELEETYYNESYIWIKSDNWHTYYPWSYLPNSLYSQEGYTVAINQLFIIPGTYKEKEESEVLAFCEKQAATVGL